MTTTHPLRPSNAPLPSPARPMLTGAVINLCLMIVFLAGVKHPHAEWGQFWMVRPLLVLTFAGATGGACYYFISRIFSRYGWHHGLALILSVIVYIIGLWMGTVLGLAGTLWH